MAAIARIAPVLGLIEMSADAGSSDSSRVSLIAVSANLW
jgi:hypothetical protein